MRAWYCARTEGNKEFLARDELRRKGIETFLPCYLVKYKSYNTRRNILIRSYIFFTLDSPMHWPRVRYAPGITKILTFSDEVNEYLIASPVASSAIETMIGQCQSEEQILRSGTGNPDRPLRASQRVQEPEQIISAGCHVRIKNGPLAAFSEQKPLVEWEHKDRAGLILSIFGRQSVIEFYKKDLELVE